MLCKNNGLKVFEETMGLICKTVCVFCVCFFLEFEVTGKCSTQSWTSCFCPPTVTSVRLINLPSFIDRQDQTGKESLLFPLPQTVTWGAEKHDTPNTHPGTQSDGRNMPVPALVQPVSPFIILSAQYVLDWTRLRLRDCVRLLQGAKSTVNIIYTTTSCIYFLSVFKPN